MKSKTGAPAKAMLDTSVCIEIMRGNALSEAYRGWQFCISSIVESELWAGVHQSGTGLGKGNERDLNKVKLLLSAVETREFGSKAAEKTGFVLGALAREGIRIGDFDSLIAGHCLALELPLITSNIRHFSRVEGLGILEP